MNLYLATLRNIYPKKMSVIMSPHMSVENGMLSGYGVGEDCDLSREISLELGLELDRDKATDKKCRECLQKIREHGYYTHHWSRSESILDTLTVVFTSRTRPLTIQELLNDSRLKDYNPMDIYYLMDLWVNHPQSYFQYGKIVKKYPVYRQGMPVYGDRSVDTKRLDVLVKDIHSGSYKPEQVRREIIQTFRTMPYFRSFGGRENSKSSEKVGEPVWIYLDPKNPLARQNDSFLEDRPFLEEILLNGFVNYPEFIK